MPNPVQMVNRLAPDLAEFEILLPGLAAAVPGDTVAIIDHLEERRIGAVEHVLCSNGTIRILYVLPPPKNIETEHPIRTHYLEFTLINGKIMPAAVISHEVPAIRDDRYDQIREFYVFSKLEYLRIGGNTFYACSSVEPQLDVPIAIHDGRGWSITPSKTSWFDFYCKETREMATAAEWLGPSRTLDLHLYRGATIELQQVLMGQNRTTTTRRVTFNA